MGLIGIQWKFPAWQKAFDTRFEELQMFIAAQMQTNRGLLFDKSGDVNGHPRWAPLVFRTGQPLKKTGALSKSMGPRNDGITAQRNEGSIVKFNADTITIGTSLAYAAMMNWGTTRLPGGVLRPKNAKALKIPTGQGKFIFRKSVKIPERRFDTWTEEDEIELKIAVETKLGELFNGL